MALRRVEATIGLADLARRASPRFGPKKGRSGFRARAGDAAPGPHSRGSLKKILTGLKKSPAVYRNSRTRSDP